MADSMLIDALAERVRWYQRLAKLAEIQHEHVRQGQTEELLAVLTHRQEVLGELARLEGVLAPARGRWAAWLGTLAGDDRARAERFLAEERRLLEEITAADRHDALVLQQRKLNLGRQIQAATTARAVNRKYAVAAYGPRESRMDVSSH